MKRNGVPVKEDADLALNKLAISRVLRLGVPLVDFLFVMMSEKDSGRETAPPVQKEAAALTKRAIVCV